MSTSADRPLCPGEANLFESEFLTDSAASKQSLLRWTTAALEALRTALPQQPYSGKNPAELSSFIDSEALLPSGLPLKQVAEKLQSIIRHSVNVNHPYAIAHLHCPPLIPSLAAEIVISALNQSMDSFDQAPIATILEQKMIQWLCAQAEFPAAAGGTFTTGGSLSNYMGLLLARDAALQKHWNWSAQTRGLPSQARTLRILCSEVAHFTVEKSAAQLGLGTDSVVRIPVDEQFRMSTSALRNILESLKQQSLLPMAIVATAGTTDFGSIDPLSEIAAISRETCTWLHVDAAYGGALLFSGQHRGKLSGIHCADSLSIDFHKLFWQPIPCSAFLLRDVTNFDFVKMHADYLNPESHEEEGIPNLVTTSILTSRRFDALKLWISLQSLGRDKLAAMIDRTIQLASDAATMVRKMPNFELMCEPQLGTVVFRYVPTNPDKDFDKINFAIRQRLFETGKAVIGHTRVRNHQCMKFTCMNPATSEVQLQDLLETIRATGVECEKKE
jgi:L-2,4-diaminobutyrate decarboxylase